MTAITIDVFPNVIAHPIRALRIGLRRYRVRRLWGKIRVLQRENERLRDRVEALDLSCKLLAEAANDSRTYLEIHTAAAERVAAQMGLRDKR